MIYPVVIKIAKIRHFQPTFPSMRSHAFGRTLAYWHARIMRMSSRKHSYTRPARMTRLQYASRKAHAYTREYLRKRKHLHRAQYPRCVHHAGINYSPIS